MFAAPTDSSKGQPDGPVGQETERGRGTTVRRQRLTAKEKGSDGKREKGGKRRVRGNEKKQTKIHTTEAAQISLKTSLLNPSKGAQLKQMITYVCVLYRKLTFLKLL